ncbi:hypothetical protein AURDEDRAFT_110500 [Auricularia subglabra TFB-10046 SS5]|nr:hypothetical protein AURDEDRAFT_110500 [Auricularia subglabra TFB-10046 SS5]
MDLTANSLGLFVDDAMDVVQEWTQLTESMDVDEVMDAKAEKRYLALDTNVLVSCLRLVQELGEFVEEHALGVEFLIAGVVVEELDNLKKRGTGKMDGQTGKDLGLAARAASNWLLDNLRHRHKTGKGLIRGQAFSETLQPSGTWKSRAYGESNDQMILECCLYFSPKRKVYLLTMDKNFGNQSLMNGIPIIVCDPKWNFMRVYAAMTPEIQDSSWGSMHVSTRRFQHARHEQRDRQGIATSSQPTAPPHDSMAIDDEVGTNAQVEQNPMDAAHVEICGLALPLLRKAAAAVVQLERERLTRGGREASIHSGARNAGFAYVKDLPSESDIALANSRTCLNLIWRLSKADKPFHGLLAFLVPWGERGARRGRDFSRGDWHTNGRELVRLGEAVNLDEITKLGNQITEWVAVP